MCGCPQISEFRIGSIEVEVTVGVKTPDVLLETKLGSSQRATVLLTAELPFYLLILDLLS